MKVEVTGVLLGLGRVERNRGGDGIGVGMGFKKPSLVASPLLIQAVVVLGEGGKEWRCGYQQRWAAMVRGGDAEDGVKIK
ncbi:hypothetical protein Dimus_001517 [Dionaea muscipula]